MDRMKLSYSILQYSPHPERFEFLNVGVLLFDASGSLVAFRMSEDFSRVKKVFDGAHPAFLKVALRDFVKNISYEVGRKRLELDANEFNAKRASIFQITPIMPVVGDNPKSVLERLYSELVSEKPKRERGERVRTRLTTAFRDAGVLQLLEKKPEPVRIERYGVSIKAAFAYQNGVRNLIDAAKFDEAERGLAEAGKRVLEGRALSESFRQRLVVVGDFGDQPDSFVGSIREELQNAGARLFALDEVGALADEIRRTAH